MRRRHGLQWPLDPHQVTSFVVFGFLVAGCYAFFLPFLSNTAAQIALGSVYGILVFVVFALAYISSSTDPSDPGLHGGSDGEYYCALCTASVSRTSKHCRACDRCVEGFDHHCKWLNNCVGAKNYRPFFMLVIITVTMLLVQAGWGLYLFSRSFYDQTGLSDIVATSYWVQVNYRGWQAVLALYLLLLAAAIIMLGELFFFHLVLVSKNMTTYDYIIANSNKDSGNQRPSSGTGTGARAALCRSARVADESATTAPVKKAKVGLNICKALTTEKLQGDPHSWGLGGSSGLPAVKPQGAMIGTALVESNNAGFQPSQGLVIPAAAALGNKQSAQSPLPGSVHNNQQCSHCTPSSSAPASSSGHMEGGVGLLHLQSPTRQLPASSLQYVAVPGYLALNSPCGTTRPVSMFPNQVPSQPLSIPFTSTLAAAAMPVSGSPHNSIHQSPLLAGLPPMRQQPSSPSSTHYIGSRAAEGGYSAGSPLSTPTSSSSRQVASGSRFLQQQQQQQRRQDGWSPAGPVSEGTLNSEAFIHLDSIRLAPLLHNEMGSAYHSLTTSPVGSKK
ncbi:hypothetical protein CEUSTIGMA_g4967.t1 [Chlamydomonas eustigma]|uniref:S-acyltransferase n=1 Tax=Chlamydomonas eustigma TaxID=1157962 RepID=A0A250X369_9CHLO|nr:hypothetical protein CEUSTIGMA_g4967.t1 [Chlamydomonas eustigma]|eukprot:GAX77523.1 hypothetical protein CEUSTIGMA_g4967.t1 [Chlamydomonas eustigma]